MRGIRNLLWIVPLCVAVSGPAWWPWACDFLRPRGDFGSAPGIHSPERRARAFAMQDVVITQARGGKAEMEVQAANARSLESETILEMREVRAVLFDAHGNPNQLAGRMAVYDSTKQVLSLAGKVSAAAHVGYQVETEALCYLAVPRKVAISAPVRIVGQGTTVTGSGLTYALDSGEFQVAGRVLVTVEPEGALGGD